MSFFDINNIFLTVLGYPLSYLEFFATLTGLIAVWLSAKANLWSWPLGIVNVTLFFFLVYQVQLYPDMFLQIFFFITNIIGWWRWANPKAGEEDQKNELKVSWMATRMIVILSLITVVLAVMAGSLASNLHDWFPVLFNKPSAFPYFDSFVMVTAILSTYLMVQKKVENWITWIVANVVAAILYFSKGILFVGMEYSVFCLINVFGFLRWRKEFRAYSK
jgi:nicotinamide mononucleotide transporter